MTRPFSRSIIAVVLISVPSFAFGATVLECDSEAGELIACASIPPDAPESAIGPSRSTAISKTSLISREDLSGALVDSSMHSRVQPLRRGQINSAMLASLEAEAQVRRIELFLKSGPAASGDLRVVEIGKPR